jgi:DNA (cytosine-5)-methyltransferase 1
MLKTALSANQTSTPRKPILRAVDFFCGAGGMSFGLSRAGVKVLAGLDLDESCRSTYEQNMRGATFLACDVAKLRTQSLITSFEIHPNDDSLLLTGCSPCQFWSKINTDRTKSKQSAFLLKEFSRFVDDLRPGWVIVENVPGIVNKQGSALPGFLRFLTRLGYAFEHAVLDLSQYGIPQTRNRFVLIANRLGLPASLPRPSQLPVPTVRRFLGKMN